MEMLCLHSKVKLELPWWVGKHTVHEGREDTMELLRVWANWIGEPEPTFNTDWSVSDKDFIGAVCDLVNTKYFPKSKALENPERKGTGIWVGFPDTPTGRLNSSIASQLWHMEEGE